MKVILDCSFNEMEDATKAAKVAIERSSFSGGYAVIGYAFGGGGLWVVRKNKNSYTVRRNKP